MQLNYNTYNMRPTSSMCFWNIFCAGLLLQSACSLNPIKMVTSRIPKLNARIEKVVPCDEFPNTTVEFKNMIINQVGFNQFSVWGDISITEPFDRPIRLENELSQCFGKGDTSTCEYYFTYKQDKVCDLLEHGDKTWEFFTKYTDFPKQCPFPPKTYHVNGSQIDLQAISYLPVFPSYWRIKNKAFQNDKLMFCIESEVSLKIVMNH